MASEFLNNKVKEREQVLNSGSYKEPKSASTGTSQNGASDFLKNITEQRTSYNVAPYKYVYSRPSEQEIQAAQDRARQQAMTNFVRNVNQGRQAYNDVTNILQQNQERKAREAALQRLLSTLPQSEISSSNRPANQYKERDRLADVANDVGQTWDAASAGILRALGAEQYAKLGNALVNKIPATNGLYEDALKSLQQQTVKAQQEHPMAYSVGSRIGTVGKMMAFSGAAGDLLGASIGGIGYLPVDPGLSGALTFAGLEAVDRIGDVAAGDITPGRYAKGIATAGLGGFVAGKASDLVGSGLSKYLKKNGLSDAFNKAVRNVSKSFTYGTTNLGVNQAVAYGTNDNSMKLTKEQIKDQVVNIALWSMLNGFIDTAIDEQRTKARVSRLVDEAYKEYEKLGNFEDVIEPLTPEAIQELEMRLANGSITQDQYNAEILLRSRKEIPPEMWNEQAKKILSYTSEIRRTLNNADIIGNRDDVTKLNATLNIIEKSTMDWLDARYGGASATSSMGSAPANASENPIIVPGNMVNGTTPNTEPPAPTNVSPVPINMPPAPTPGSSSIQPTAVVDDAAIPTQGIASVPVRDQLFNLAQRNEDIKAAQRQALYDAGKNQEQNIQPLMDSSTMLSEEEKFAAVRQGNLDAVNSEKDAIKAETAQPLEIESVKKNLGSDDPQTRYNAIKTGIDSGIVSANEALSNALSDLDESGFDPKNLIDSITKLYMNADSSLTEDDARAELVSDAGAGINPFADIDGYEREEVTMDRLIDSIQPYVNNAIDTRSETSSTNGAGRDILNEVRESISSLYPNAPKGEIDDAAEGIAEIRSTAQTTGAYRSLSSVRKPSTISEPNGSTKSGIPGRSGLVSGNQGNMAQSLDSNSGIKTVALGITDQFVKKGYVDLRGRKLSSDTRTAADEVATLAMVFRNPKFETFRTIYTKGNTIVGTEAITSYLVSGSATTKEKTGIDWVNDVTDRMRRLQADGYYILHNHPSGDPTPSTEDSSTSQAYAQYVPGYKGHIVIDHNTYSFIDSKGKSSGIQVVNSKTAKNFNERVIDSPYLYRTLTTPSQVADVALNLVHDPEYSSIIFANAKGEVRAIQEVHNNFINTRDFQNYLRNRKRDFGSTFAFLATQSDSVYASSDIENAYHKNLLTDVLQLQNRNDVSSYNASGYKTGGSTFNSLGQRQDKTGAYRVNESANNYGDIQTRINQSMTMKQAENMIQSAWGLVRDWYDDGEYKNAWEWLEGEGADAVADQVENDRNLYERYIAKDDGLREYEYSISDVVDAYIAGTLVGHEKPKPVRLDVSQPTGMQDNRFYAPRQSKASKETYDLACSKATGKNKDAVFNARKDILFAAHNGNLAEELGIKPSELNKKLRSWSNYPASAIQTSMRINHGAAPENQWTGIQNSSILSKMAVTDDDIRKAVKEVIGSGNQYERNYIARTMLAIDTHTDWSWLTVEFVKGRVDQSRSSVRGQYYRGKVRIGSSAGAETVAHEMGHALDYKWESDVFGKHGLGQPLSSIALREDLAKSPEALQFFKNFRTFMQSLYDVNDTRSAYTNEPTEVFARFVAKFVEWVDGTAGNNFYKESLSYNDRFNTGQFVEFAKLLQEKAMLDGMGLTDNGSPALLEDDSANGKANDSIDLKLSERSNATNWNEGFAAPDEDVMDISDDRQQFMQSLADSNDTVKALNVALGRSLDNKLTVNADASKVANSIVKKYRSGTDADKVSSDIEKLYGSLGDAAKDSVNKIATAAADIGAEILDGIKTTDKTMQDSYPNLKKELKSYKLTMSDQDKNDVGSAYDGFNNFRKKMFGKLTLVKQDTKGAVPVDTAYQELSEKYPDLFPDDIIALPEQMVRMAEVANSLKATKVHAVEGMDEYDYEMQAYVIGQEILKDYYTAAGETGYGKVFDAELAKVRQKYEKQIQRLKASNNAKVDRVKQKYEDRIAKANARRKLTKTGNDLLKEFRKLKKMKGGPEFEAAKQALIGDFDLYSKGMRDDTKLKLEKLRDEAEALKEKDVNYANSNYDKDFKTFSRLNLKHIKNLSLDEMEELIEAAVELRHAQEIQNKVLKDNKRISAATIARRGIEQQRKAKSLNKNNELGSLTYRMFRGIEGYNFQSLSAVRALRAMDGYRENGVLSGIGKDLNDGYIRSVDFEMKARKSFEEFTNDKKFMDSLSKPTVEIKNPANGKTAMITPGMRMAVYLMSKDPDNRNHIKSGGLCIPNVKLYTQRAGKEAYADDVRFRLEYTDLQDIYSGMTDREKAFADRMFQFYNGGKDVLITTKDAMNETSMLLNGHEIAFSDNHYPISTNKNFIQGGAKDKYQNPTIEGGGFLKERKVNASNPIYLEDATDVLNRSINNVKNYYGLAVPIRNANAILNFTESGFDTSLRQEIDKAWKGFGLKIIDNIIDDLNAGGRRHGVEPGKLDKFQSRYVTSVFAANAGVAMKQFSSYLMALAYLHPDSMLKGLNLANRVDLDYIDSITPLHWARRKGMSGTELGEVYDYRQGVTGKLEKGANRLTNGITHVDVFTTKRLISASIAEMKKYHPEFKEGTPEYDAKLAELINNVFQLTQPSYDVLHRSEYQRSTGDFARIMSMFSTASLNMSGEVADAFGEFRAKMDQAKTGEGTKADARRAASRWAKVLNAYILAQVSYTAIGALWNLALHKGKNYRDEKGEITAESFIKRVGSDAIENIIGGGFFGGKQVVGIATLNWDDMVLPGLSSFNSTMNDITDFIEAFGNLLTGEATDNKKIKKAAFNLARDLGAVGLGLPINTFYNFANAGKLWIDDIKNGKLGTWDAGEGLFGLSDTSVNKKEYAQQALSAIENGDQGKADYALQNTGKEQLEAALGAESQKKEDGKTIKDSKRMDALKKIDEMNINDTEKAKLACSMYDFEGVNGDNWKEYINTLEAEMNGKQEGVIEYLSTADISEEERRNLWENACGYSPKTYEKNFGGGETEAETKAETEPETEAEIPVETEPETEAETVPETEPETEAVKPSGSGAEIESEITEGSIEGDARYAYIVDAVQNKKHSAEEAVAWYNSDPKRVNAGKYIAWTNAGGSTYDYIKTRSDLSKFKGNGKQEKIANYILNQGYSEEKQRVIWFDICDYSEKNWNKYFNSNRSWQDAGAYLNQRKRQVWYAKPGEVEVKKGDPLGKLEGLRSHIKEQASTVAAMAAMATPDRETRANIIAKHFEKNVTGFNLQDIFDMQEHNFPSKVVYAAFKKLPARTQYAYIMENWPRWAVKEYEEGYESDARDFTRPNANELREFIDKRWKLFEAY